MNSHQDIVRTKLADMSATQLYYFYEGFGALLAVIAESTGLLLKPQGLFYRRAKGYTFLVSEDPATILRVLRYNGEAFEQGFASEAEIFAYLESSPLYNPRRFFKRVRHPMAALESRKFGLYKRFENALKAKSPGWDYWTPKEVPKSAEDWRWNEVPQALLWAGPDFLERYQQGVTVEKTSTVAERSELREEAKAVAQAQEKQQQEERNGKLDKLRIARVTGRNRSSARALISAMRKEHFNGSYPDNWEELWPAHINSLSDEALNSWMLSVHQRLKATS